MPVPKGQRHGGRQKGTPNKATAEIRERIDSNDPIGRLFELADECRTEGERDLEARTLTAVLPYAYPRLAASSIDVKALLTGPTALHVHAPAKKKDKKR